MKEAAKLGFQGTPGFLLNGIAVKGAYPASHFEKLIEELKKHGKLKL
jgi:protein-disulfide isomerase